MPQVNIQDNIEQDREKILTNGYFSPKVSHTLTGMSALLFKELRFWRNYEVIEIT
jgi:hypothetical protein